MKAKKEYIGICPRCAHHTIVSSTKQITPSTKQVFTVSATKEIFQKTIWNYPHRMTKCVNCGSTVRATIIGIVSKIASATVHINPEFATTNTLRIRFWK
jgi:hypothetical protein